MKSDKKGSAVKFAKLGCLLFIILYVSFPFGSNPACFSAQAFALDSELPGRMLPSTSSPEQSFEPSMHDGQTPVRVIVRMNNPGDEVGPKKVPPSGKRAVFNRLKDRNVDNQASLSRHLSRNGSGTTFHSGVNGLSEGKRTMHSLWIANSVALDATPEEVAKLRQHPDVAGVYENTVLSVPPVTTGETGTSSQPNSEWNFDSIRLGALRTLVTGNGTGVRIGQLDTGINSTIPELQGKVVAWSEFDAHGNKVNSVPHETHPLGHGTHVASVMVGTTSGIAPGSQLLSSLVLPDGYGTLEQVLAGMQWVLDPDGDATTADDGADIVNMSFGIPGECTPVWDAVENMVLAGVLPVAAIGNGGSGYTCSPGNAPGAIGVGAVDSYGQVPLFSSGGQDCRANGSCFIKPDISAPGVNVPGFDGQGNYQTLTGTSLAAPHVSGVAALLMNSVPSVTASQLRAFLLNAPVNLNTQGQDARYGWGQLDALASWQDLKGYNSRLNAADLVVESSDSLSHRYLTFFTDGSGSFLAGEKQELDLVTQGSSTIETLGVADVNGDGFADLIVMKTEKADNGSYLISYVVYLSLNGKGFSNEGATWYSFASTNPKPYELIGIADVDGDKRADLVLAVRESTGYGYYLHVLVLASTGESFRNTSNGYWANISYSLDEKFNVAMADVTGDGKADLVVARTFNYSYGRYPAFYWVYPSLGSTFQWPTLWTTHYPYYQTGPLSFFALADVNGDGRADLIVTVQGQNNPKPHTTSVYVCLAARFSGFQSPQLWAEIKEGASQFMAMGDANGDRLADLIAGSCSADIDTCTFTIFLADKQKQSFIPVPAQSGSSVPTPHSPGIFRLLAIAEVGLGAW